MPARKLHNFQVFDLSAEQAGKKASKTSLPAGLPAGGGQGRAFEVLNPDNYTGQGVHFCE